MFCPLEKHYTGCRGLHSHRKLFHLHLVQWKFNGSSYSYIFGWCYTMLYLVLSAKSPHMFDLTHSRQKSYLLYPLYHFVSFESQSHLISFNLRPPRTTPHNFLANFGSSKWIFKIDVGIWNWEVQQTSWEDTKNHLKYRGIGPPKDLLWGRGPSEVDLSSSAITAARGWGGWVFFFCFKV